MENYIKDILKENKQIVSLNSQILKNNNHLKKELRTFYAGIEKYHAFKKSIIHRQNSQGLILK